MLESGSDGETRSQSSTPNYQGLWCWACQEHTAYHFRSTTQRVFNNDVGSRVATYEDFTCVTCKSKMYTPQVWDPVVFKRPAERGCLWIYLISVAIGISFFFISFLATELIYRQPILLVFSCVVAIGLVVLPHLIIRWSGKKYGIWKSWAMQRGWREPSLEKRMKMEVRRF